MTILINLMITIATMKEPPDYDFRTIANGISKKVDESMFMEKQTDINRFYASENFYEESMDTQNRHIFFCSETSTFAQYCRKKNGHRNASS